MIMVVQGKKKKKKRNTYLARGVVDVDILDVLVLVDVLEVLGLEILLGVEEVVGITVDGVAVEEV
jgi:hypothetical protein